MIIARVFPRRTKATPNDALCFFDAPGLFPVTCDEVHVSCAFTWDMPRAEYLAREWEAQGYTVKLGGPATGMRGEDFVPGRYLANGYVITSRGCENNCWFCEVWKRDGGIRELPITDGWNVLDDNLLQCSESHIREVFDMLKRQHNPVEFTGGLEAARLKPWHVDLLADLKPKQMFFAYDTADDYEPLIVAGRMLTEAGFTLASRSLRAYVLIGYPGDTFDAADRRLRQTLEAGFMPMAMLYRDRDHEGKTNYEWRRFQRLWARPALIASRCAV